MSRALVLLLALSPSLALAAGNNNKTDIQILQEQVATLQSQVTTLQSQNAALTFYRGATGRVAGRSGSVTVVQRFGSALNLNLHFHIVHLDGVFDRGADGALRFFSAPPTTEDIERLVEEIGGSSERWLARQGFAGADEDATEDAGDTQGVLQLASLTGTHALGDRAGRTVRRVVTLGGRAYALPPRCAAFAGYNLHANVALAASDRGGLERLCRYVLRPPLALGRLEHTADGRVRVGMKRVWSDGTSALELSPLELVEKLCALIPPPRVNLVRYHGVLAAHAAWRREVVPTAPSSTAAEEEARIARRLSKKAGRRGSPASASGWAELLWRVFRVDGWHCPGCGAQMRLRLVADHAPTSLRILTGLVRPRGPPHAPPVGEDQGAFA